MAAPGKSSRWGSFLAGVESRLDNMLSEAEANEATQKQREKETTQQTQVQPSKPQALNVNALQPGIVKQSPSDSRSSSHTRTNDRLQARLAKAMVGKSASNVSPRSSIDSSSRQSFERSLPESGRFNENDILNELKNETGPNPNSNAEAQVLPIDTSVAVQHDTSPGKVGTGADETNTKLTSELLSAANVVDYTMGIDKAAKLGRELEEVEARHQDEIRDYVERIDSLQSKLSFLSKNVAEAAKKTVSEAPSGSMEKSLAEKDEKIALLMEEGSKLATGEQKYRGAIKKLRQQVAENDKEIVELKRTRDKAVADTQLLRSQIDANADKEKKQEDAKRMTAALQKEVDTLKKERFTRDETIRRLERELRMKVEQAEKADSLNKSLVNEKAKLKVEEDRAAALHAEKEKLANKARHDEIEWEDRLKRAIERGRTIEADLKMELQATESKLEAIRAQAEEVTSGSVGEAQIKLLRQIETLQSQYASASDNWQSIEASLIAKVSNLEKEKDEAQRRESEMRKKARDATTRARDMEDELQDLQLNLVKSQQALDTLREEMTSVRASAKSTEDVLEQVRADFEKERQAISRDYTPEREQRRWVEDVAGATTTRVHNRPDSPLLYTQRTLSSDLMSSGAPHPSRPRVSPNPGSNPDTAPEILYRGRLPSGQPPLRSSVTTSTLSSGPPPAPYSPFQPLGGSPPVMSPPAIERDSELGDKPPSSPQQIAQDMISISTVAAGPSVQLVERMSAAIRRLEAEKVAAKEEMIRVCGQRDEARSDMVKLLKELEEAKSASAKLPQLEQDVATLDERYQTTLEMLGEKSELVEELRADIQDVKAMYRELVERTVI